jgi:hypothetical protein
VEHPTGGKKDGCASTRPLRHVLFISEIQTATKHRGYSMFGSGNTEKSKQLGTNVKKIGRSIPES